MAADVDDDAEPLQLAHDLHAEVAEPAGLRIDATGTDIVADIVRKSGTSQAQIMEAKKFVKILAQVVGTLPSEHDRDPAFPVGSPDVGDGGRVDQRVLVRPQELEMW